MHLSKVLATPVGFGVLGLVLLLAAAPADAVAPAAQPPLRAWSSVWHSVGTVEYSSCPGVENGQQEAFTLAIKADDKAITATETPEQGVARKLIGTADRRGNRWVLQLRARDGKNGMDVALGDAGNLTGTRVLVRKHKKLPCSVVYGVAANRDEG